jgi:hypothetical protein
MTIWTKTRNRYERTEKPVYRYHKWALCPNDGTMVMPYTGNMGAHDEGICPKCGPVKFVMVDEREIGEYRKAKQIVADCREKMEYVIGSIVWAMSDPIEALKVTRSEEVSQRQAEHDDWLDEQATRESVRP